MRDIRIGAGQFEARDADKAYNLSRVEALTRQAAAKGAEMVSFHECCVTGYTFLMTLSRSDLTALAEPVPGGASVRRLAEMAGDFGAAILAGLVEVEGDRLYNSYVAVTGGGVAARHRKLHPFISPHLSAGDSYTVFDLNGCRCGILTCYDNNLPENVRVTALLGAEIIFAPHVTCGTQSSMPGRGRIPREVWENRHMEPVHCRQEFLGPKGRGWLMRWLPARAWENGVFMVFTNAVGVDHDTIKNGNAMILDPHGEILVESHELGDDVVVATLPGRTLETASGRRYRRSRRPELYGKLVEPHPEGESSRTDPGWTLERPADAGR